MPRVLSLKKIKGKKEHAHPHSRKANQIQRAALRDERIKGATARREKDRYTLINRVGFFKVAVITGDRKTLTEDEVHELIKTYINRRQGELEDEKAARRPGRPKSTKEDLLSMAIEQEQAEYKTGFKVPDMTDEVNVINLKAWKGDHGGLNHIKLVELPRRSDE
ncbi:translation machinery-associated protein 16 [Savitreella phatthalungensis]